MKFAKFSNPSLFLGTTPALARKYLQGLFAECRSRGRYVRVVVPCAGRFSGPLMALRAGFSPALIHASDISLFSGIIGHLAAGREPKNELSVRVELDWLPELEELVEQRTGADWGAAVLLAQKLGAMAASNAYQRMFVEDLRKGWQRHLESDFPGSSSIRTRYCPSDATLQVGRRPSFEYFPLRNDSATRSASALAPTGTVSSSSPESYHQPPSSGPPYSRSSRYTLTNIQPSFSRSVNSQKPAIAT